MKKNDNYKNMKHSHGLNQQKILTLGCLLMVWGLSQPGFCYCWGVNGSGDMGIQEGNSDSPGIEKPRENAGKVDQEPMPIPPEVLEMLLQQANQEPGFAESFRPLNASYRILLLGVAVIIIFLGVLICRYLRGLSSWHAQENAIFLFFGFPGALSALFIACGCVGSLYLHVAAAACTAISGFTIAALLVPQFSLTRRLVLGNRHGKLTPGDLS